MVVLVSLVVVWFGRGLAGWSLAELGGGTTWVSSSAGEWREHYHGLGLRF